MCGNGKGLKKIKGKKVFILLNYFDSKKIIKSMNYDTQSSNIECFFRKLVQNYSLNFQRLNKIKGKSRLKEGN